MGSGPRTREGPRPGRGRRRLGRAVAGPLPRAVTAGLLRVAPVLGRGLGLRRALAGGAAGGGGGDHRPLPPRLWWAAPWRRWGADPEPILPGSGRASPVGAPTATATPRAAVPAFINDGRLSQMNAGSGRIGSSAPNAGERAGVPAFRNDGRL